MKNKLTALLLLAVSSIIFFVGYFVGFFICLIRNNFTDLKDLKMFYKASKRQNLKVYNSSTWIKNKK